MTTITRFATRSEAGQLLAEQLAGFNAMLDVLVLALPRGGVPVGYEVAKALNAPLDLLVVRKLAVPGYPELAMGAIALGDVRVLNEDIVKKMGITEETIELAATAEEAELDRQELAYRGGRPPVDVRGRTVIVVDDGLATGASMRAAVAVVRRMGARHVVVAVPVAATEARRLLERDADEVICLLEPRPFGAISQCYEQFPQLTDVDVRALIGRIARQHAYAAS